jgi:hypothetical protein
MENILIEFIKTNVPFIWTQGSEKTFKKLKKLFIEAPVRSMPDPERP